MLCGYLIVDPHGRTYNVGERNNNVIMDFSAVRNIFYLFLKSCISLLSHIFSEDHHVFRWSNQQSAPFFNTSLLLRVCMERVHLSSCQCPDLWIVLWNVHNICVLIKIMYTLNTYIQLLQFDISLIFSINVNDQSHIESL